jgi:glycosyltransferase involved in cell wall biosynthesis
MRAAVFGLEQPRIARYERRVLATFDTSVLVSQVDRDYLAQDQVMPAGDVLVCPNGIDLESYPFQRHDPDSTTVAFVGNLQSLQNLDAVFWFAKEVLPRLRARDLGYRLKVIGRIRRWDRARLAQIPGVDVTGEVDAIAAHLAGCLCGVCPVRIGAGIQNKILEYMAAGLPAIVSTIGLEGLRARPGEDLLVANEPRDYEAAILTLRGPNGRGRTLAVSGRRYVEQHHNWTQNLQPLVDRLKALTA